MTIDELPITRYWSHIRFSTRLIKSPESVLKTCPTVPPVAGEFQCRRARVCLCEHLSGGAAESDHPRVPPEGCCEAPGPHAAGQQPGCQGDCHWSSQVRREDTARGQSRSIYIAQFIHWAIQFKQKITLKILKIIK